MENFFTAATAAAQTFSRSKPGARAQFFLRP